MKVSRLLVVVACVSACARTSPFKTLDAAAESYVRLVLALGERDSDSLDSYHRPPEWQADAQAKHLSFGEIRAATGRLIDSLAAMQFYNYEAETRRVFLIRQLHAVGARIDLLGGVRKPFVDEARDFFGDMAASSAANAPPGADADDIRAEVGRLLPGSGDLSRRYAGFDQQFLVPPDRLPTVLSRALDGCRTATAAHVSLPPGERLQIEYVPTLAWSAFTRYRGHSVSVVQINSSLPLTVDRAVDLACHEGYPGHHTIDSLLDARDGGRRIELTVRPLFSPQALLHEAAASIAADLAFPGSARTTFERDALFPLAGLDGRDAERYVRVSRLVDALHGVQADIIRRYLNGDLDFPRASALLERDALMPSADATLTFVNRFRTYAATYTLGRDLFARYLDAQPDQSVAGRWQAYVNAVTDRSQTLPRKSTKDTTDTRKK